MQVSKTPSRCGEHLLLRQALGNLLDNAIAFSARNQTSRFLPHQAVEFAYVLMIKGTGIPDYAIDKLFDRFYSLPDR